MKIRLGYVSIALNLPKVTASSSVTYTNYMKIKSRDQRLNKLKKVTLSNINDLQKILNYNVSNDIHFYRITSALVPLATHPNIEEWNYRKIFDIDFKILGEFIKENNMRVDTHPDEFNVINSEREEVVESTKRNLFFHANLFKDLNYDYGKMVIHIGGGKKDKKGAIKRFIDNFEKYPKEITSKLVLENDDKTFNVKDVLYICKKTKCPMVLDVHHHKCNNDGEKIEDYLEKIFETWDNEYFPPKVHFSTPKIKENDRRHADFIEPYSFINFLEECRKLNIDFDVMIEAKQKDKALFQLIKDIKQIKSDWKWLDKTTLYI